MIEGHVASIVGWTDPGNDCAVTGANARLIEHAPDMADTLGQLLAWAGLLGCWDGPCWRHAELVFGHATGGSKTPAALTVQSVQDVLAPISRGEGWNAQTERTLLTSFLDDLARSDPNIPARLQQHLREATDV